MSWYAGVLGNYAVFSGRARRREYWMFAFYHAAALLVLWLLTMALSFPFRDSIDGDGGAVLVIPLALYYFGTLVPLLAVTVRRLHDTGRSGVWLLMGLIPGGVGAIIMIVLLSQEGDPHPNRYGPDPKAPQGFHPPLVAQQPVPGAPGGFAQPGSYAQSGPYAQPGPVAQPAPYQPQPGPRHPSYRIE
ncbi:DUF805 domain-containing protein [Glycomyces terrestris]|uniref:DUF805 domain-containing protein n=1 Tax=Glycomyces terrestris TaxID=2493553 RepID=A0A426UWP4_9ACTN|nr:DUF805 domain-containing protein [Glycomyces terrestris]